MNGYNSVVIVLFIVFSATIVSCDLFSNLTDVEHVSRAKEFRDTGDLRATEIELKSALQKNPKNAEARWLLGLVNVELGNGPAAEKELRRALELGIARQAIVQPLGKSLLLQRKFQEVLDEISVDEVPDSADQALIVVYRGDAWLGKKKVDKANTEYERALRLHPQFALAKLGLARVASAEKNNEKAIALFAEALKIAPQDGSIWSYQASLFSEIGDLSKAEESYSKAIQYRKKNPDDILNRAYVRIRKKDYEGAQKDIDALGNRLSDHYLTHYARGLLYYTQKKYPEAQTALEKSLSLYGGHFPTVYLLGVSYLMQENFTQADHQLSRFLRANPYSIKGNQMLALTKYRMRNYQAAKTALQPLLTSIPDDLFSLRLMAKVEFALGNPDKGLVYLKHVAELRPDSPDSLMSLGVGRIATGSQELGIQELEKALKLDPQLTEAEVAIAAAYINSKQFDKARPIIDRLGQEHPDNPVSANLTGMLYLGMGEAEKANSTFESILKKHPGNLSASNYLAKQLFQDKKIGESRAVYDEVLRAHPKHLPTEIKLADLDAFEGDFQSMEKRLEVVINNHPEALSPRLMLGRYYLRFGQPGRTQTLLGAVKERYAKNPNFLMLLAESQLADNQSARAKETAEQLVRANPESAASHFMLSKIYGANRDIRKMRVSLKKALEIDPKFLNARLATVKLLTHDNKIAAAKTQLTELVRDHPDDRNVLELEGWLALRDNDLERAANGYKKTLDKYPSTDLVIKLAKVQWSSGEKDKALATLTRWGEKHPNDSKADYYRAGLYSLLGQDGAAQKMLEKVILANPKNVLALNDLAWALRKKNTDKALLYVEKALETAPKAIAILDTYAMILAEKRQFERAESIMMRVISKTSNNLVFKYHLAIIQEKRGRIEEARITLKDIITSGKVFPEKGEAELLYRKLRGEG